MLAARHRLRHSAEFSAATRRGARAGSATMVVHAVRTDPSEGLPPRVGFVVSKAVGNAVMRNRVKRRLRAIAGTHLTELPEATDIVVRANPAAATASYQRLEADFTSQLASCLTSRRYTGVVTGRPS